MTEVGYASDKPSDCAYCYFFSARRKKCKRKECFYRISSPPLRRKVTHWEPCEGCPYTFDFSKCISGLTFEHDKKDSFLFQSQIL